MKLSYVIAPAPVVRRRERRRALRYWLNEVAPAFLIGMAAMAGPAILWLLTVPG